MAASSQQRSFTTLSLIMVSQVAQQLPQMCLPKLGNLPDPGAPQYAHSIPFPSWYCWYCLQRAALDHLHPHPSSIPIYPHSQPLSHLLPPFIPIYPPSPTTLLTIHPPCPERSSQTPKAVPLPPCSLSVTSSGVRDWG